MSEKQARDDEIKVFVQERNEAINDVVYKKDYRKFRDFMKTHQPPIAWQLFCDNSESTQKKIMDVMARKMMWHITTFPFKERVTALAWLKIHGCTTEIGFFRQEEN